MSAGSYPTWNSGRALRLMPQAQDREGKTEKDGGYSARPSSTDNRLPLTGREFFLG